MFVSVVSSASHKGFRSTLKVRSAAAVHGGGLVDQTTVEGEEYWTRNATATTSRHRRIAHHPRCRGRAVRHAEEGICTYSAGVS